MTTTETPDTTDTIDTDTARSPRGTGSGRGMAAKMAVLVIAITAPLLFMGASPASAATVAQMTGLTAEAPYVHRDIIGRKWIYGASSTNSTAGYAVETELYQYYGGRWNRVAYNAKSGYNYTNRAIAQVLCTGAMTNYSFFTRAWVKYNGNRYYLDSRVVTQSC